MACEPGGKEHPSERRLVGNGDMYLLHWPSQPFQPDEGPSSWCNAALTAPRIYQAMAEAASTEFAT